MSEYLVDPRDRGPLRLAAQQTTPDGEVMAGTLVARDGCEFSVSDGIANMLDPFDQGQAQTADSFGFKWKGWEGAETPSGYELTRDWFIERYFGSVEEMNEFMEARTRILDCGCGSGLSSSVYLDRSFTGELWAGADISDAVNLARKRLGHIPNTLFVKADMMRLPFNPASFDTIFAEGTLHHTPSTREAITEVSRHLAPDGLFLFYVYRKKSVIREFTDDYIRGQVAHLPPHQAMELIRPLTELGRALAEVDRDVEVPDIEVLGIPAGTYDVQRLFYWHVAKVFWNDRNGFEANNYINFDWYHPTYAHRQTPEEVRQWCSEAGLAVEHIREEDAGMTVRARRPR
jgi:arsenite methyltransferase